MALILLAEDDAVSRLYISEVLAKAGHDVIAPGDGSQLIAELEKICFDLVITDLSMPEVDGWEVARWLQQHRPETPVIAVSSFTTFLPWDQLRPFAVILRKPVRSAPLLAVVSARALSPSASGCRSGPHLVQLDVDGDQIRKSRALWRRAYITRSVERFGIASVNVPQVRAGVAPLPRCRRSAAPATARRPRREMQPHSLLA